MTRLNGLGLLFAASIMLLITMLACSDSGQTGDTTDGDVSASIGATCNSQGDCANGESCLNVGSKTICTKLCTGNLDCQDAFPGGCCEKMGTGYFCKPLYECGGMSDGDTSSDGDTVVDGDGDSSTSCIADTYRCSDYREVERCKTDGSWVKYKNCNGDSCCYQGECVSMEDGATNCEGNSFCIPDTYRCRGISEVQRCSSDGGNWDWYRDCKGGEVCDGGKCIPTVIDGDTADGDAADGDEEEAVCVACTMADGCEDSTQYCFPDKPGSSDGCCLAFCDIEGSPNCPRGTACKQGMCQQVDGYCISDADCNMDEFCFKRPGANDGMCDEWCFNMGYSCPSHSYCDENQNSANYGKCVYEECDACNYNDQCVAKYGAGYYCNKWMGQTDGCCLEMCGESNPCHGGQKCCNDGICGLNCGLTCTVQCLPPFICNPLYDACQLDCPPCPEGERCTRDSAPNCEPGACTNPLICGILLKQCCFGYRCSAIVYGVLGYCI